MPFNLSDYPEAFELPFRATAMSAWLYHLPLAPILIKVLRPGRFVELGTHAGDSYLAFCHAVKVLGTGTQCSAVDTWQGDPHAGLYGPEILAELRAVHDPHFGAFSRLLPMTFDAAAPTFPNGSIDLLHIDGMHTYEAVRHDYETWLPKLSPHGVVLFHDTAERANDFGVWKLWDEIAPAKPHVNLPYGHGLGILAVGPEQPAAFLELLHELTLRPGLVKNLEALGSRSELCVKHGLAMHQLLQCRLWVNEWRRQTGQPIQDPKPGLENALANPGAFGHGVVADVSQLTRDALNVVAEVMRLRAAKP